MSNKNEKINTQINFQIEDVMLSENINEKKSIEYLMDYYSDDECTIIFNKEYVINILKYLYNKDNDKNI